MKLDNECKACLYNSQLKKVEKDCLDQNKLRQFKQKIKLLCDAPPEYYCAPLLMRDIDRAHREVFGKGIDYANEKRLFNDCLLAIESEIYDVISGSEVPLKTAIKYAMASNLIDFARLANLDENSVQTVIERAERAVVDDLTFDRFFAALRDAKTVAYLHDNCGEIVLDKLLIRTIKSIFPSVEVVSVVRGGEIINDATKTDAEQVGLNEYSIVIDNGAAVPGTYLQEINERTRTLLHGADVIISKGLGNLETLFGEGYSVFYMFMCKCEHIARAFSLPLWSTAFVFDDKKQSV